MQSQISHTTDTGMHANQPVLHTGAPLEQAHAAAVMIHGRGASAGDILSLAPHLAPRLAADGVAFFAPQASGNTWYPHSFLAPRAQNEPYLSDALAAVASVIAQLEEQEFAVDQIVLLGFSQGACLASEYAARNPRRYGGLIAFSGGLIGPPDQPLDHTGDLAGTPVFLGCSDIDPHIPLARVEETAEVLTAMHAQVTKRIYPGMNHSINTDEIDFARKLISEVGR